MLSQVIIDTASDPKRILFFAGNLLSEFLDISVMNPVFVSILSVFIPYFLWDVFQIPDFIRIDEILNSTDFCLDFPAWLYYRIAL